MPGSLKEVEAELATRWSEARIDPTLDRVRDLMGLLGNPQRSFPAIHISGTNGKTSTARMIDALLRELGLRTGCLTSPHLQSVTERVTIDGKPISDDAFAATFEEIAPYLDMVDARHEVRLSYFEVLTALAFAAFADAPVQAGVVEVGLGGRWDATNVVDGEVCVLTPMSYDHTDYLGDSLSGIAEEKVGIIKPGSSVVIGPQHVEATGVVAAAAAGKTVARFGMEFAVRHREMAVGGQMVNLQGLAGPYDDIFVPLHGAHQAVNAAMALAAVEMFVGQGREALDHDAVQAAFAKVTSPGRLEAVRRGPVVLVDAAHNPAGASALAEALSEEFAATSLVAVVAILDNKDPEGILAALEPVVSQVVVTENSSPRCLPADDVESIAVDVFGHDRVHVTTPLPEAIAAGLALSEGSGSLAGHGVIVTGSVVTAGDARQAFGASA